MDKKNAFYNIFVSIFFKLILVIFSLFSKRYLIAFVGNEANGLFSLFTSIIGILSITDLGIGTAIVYSMYKPIVDNDEKKVKSLYLYYSKAYLKIGAIIFFSGILLLPVIPLLVKNITSNVNVYLSFTLMLIATVITYLFNSKATLINAYKMNYIETTIRSISMIFQYSLQILTLICTKSFYLYIIAIIFSNIIHGIILEIYVRKKFVGVMSQESLPLDDEIKKVIIKNTKAMFIHRIGAAIFNSIDPIIISAIIGVLALGKYSNYNAIMAAMHSILILFFTPLTSIIGHVCVKESATKKEEYFKFFYIINAVMGIIFYLGYFSVIDDLVFLIFGDGLELDIFTVGAISTCGFIQFMRQSTFLFKDATGSYYHDRWTPIVEGLLNIIFSILFAKMWGIAGVLIATMVTNLLICNIIEPYVLHKYIFLKSPRMHYLKHYLIVLAFIVSIFAFNIISVDCNSKYISIILNGGLSLAISFVLIVILAFFNRKMKPVFLEIFKSKKVDK